MFTYGQALDQVWKTLDAPGDHTTQPPDPRSLAAFLRQATTFRPTVLLERRSRAGQELLEVGDRPELHELTARFTRETARGMEFYVYDYPHEYPEGYSYKQITKGRNPKWEIALKYPDDFVVQQVTIT